MRPAEGEANEPVPAVDLYTSNYFSCKQWYDEAVAEPGNDAPAGILGWTILSAKYDILWPSFESEPYDTTIDDLEKRDTAVEPDAYQHTRYLWGEPEYHTALDFWTRRVHYGLASWLDMKAEFPEEDPHCRRLIILTDNDYLDPLLENDVFNLFPLHTTFPFKEHGFDG